LTEDVNAPSEMPHPCGEPLPHERTETGHSGWWSPRETVLPYPPLPPPKRLWIRVRSLYLKTDQQVENLGSGIPPQLCGAKGDPTAVPCANHGHVFGITLVGEDPWAIHRGYGHPLTALPPIVPVIGNGGGARSEDRRLIQSFIALLGESLLPVFRILLHLGPKGVIGRADLPRGVTSHLGRKTEAATDVPVHPLLQLGLVGHLALFEGHPTGVIQGIPVGQGSPPERSIGLWRGIQFDCGGKAAMSGW
jgi:hypothetical protein